MCLYGVICFCRLFHTPKLELNTLHCHALVQHQKLYISTLLYIIENEVSEASCGLLSPNLKHQSKSLQVAYVKFVLMHQHVSPVFTRQVAYDRWPVSLQHRKPRDPCLRSTSVDFRFLQCLGVRNVRSCADWSIL